MTYYVDPDHEPYADAYDYETPAARTEAQPDDFCECRPGVEMRHTWQHTAECLRWRPPLTGSGSTPEHRAAALAHIRAQIEDAKRRHQEVTR